MAPKPDPWVRLFDVSDAIKHRKGYTVYKVTSTLYPRAAPEALTQVVVWKRFNDFKKLHKSLQILHTKLYLKGLFPPFAKARLFGRFDDNVIEERRQSAQALLEFVAQHPPLFTSQLFVKFFECGQKISPDKIISCERDEIETRRSSDFDVDRLSLRDGGVATLEFLTERVNCEAAESNSNLGGIWQFRQEQESISLSSDSTEDRTTTDGDSVRSLGSTVELFDPLVNRSDMNRFVNNNVWLLSSMATNCKMDEPFMSDFEQPSLIELDSDLSVDASSLMNRENSDECGTELVRSPSPPLSPLSPLSGLTSNDESDYIISAANAISMAHRNEADGNYEKSFAFYKSSVEILLKGVQTDRNGLRRDAVRKKTAQYLNRAEDIYRKYLIGNEANGHISSALSPTTHMDGVIGLLQAPLSDLKNYKVIGLINKVLLVLDMEMHKTFVMKILRKTCSSSEISSSSVVPSKIRFMVQLYKFIENDYAIFLVEEHATGGRLWNYVKSYLINSPTCSHYAHAGGYESFVIHANQVPTNDSNVYSGKKLIDVEDDCVEETKKNDVDDTDLVAKGECASSYVNLFTSYAASLATDDAIGLAKCRLTSNENEFCDQRVDNEVNDDNQFDNNDDDDEGFSNENCFHDVGNDDTDCFDLNHVTTLEDLGRLEADDLINCAQRLMKNVDDTLHEAKSVDLSSAVLQTNFPTDDICVRKKKNKVEIKDRRRSQRTVTRQTSDDVFASPHHEVRLSSSTGSLPGVSRPRMRHFSAVFEQLDSANSTNICLPESCVRIWAAEIIVAVWQLHNLSIICRDLCPDNILLGSRGHILLTYFSQWACVERSLRPDALENMYAAPELNGIDIITPACDWWSVGALLFELLTGRTLVSCHPGGITNHTNLNIPNHISPEARSLLIEFLRFTPNERLGAGANGIEAIKTHSFFHNVNWDQIFYDNT